MGPSRGSPTLDGQFDEAIQVGMSLFLFFCAKVWAKSGFRGIPTTSKIGAKLTASRLGVAVHASQTSQGISGAGF